MINISDEKFEEEYKNQDNRNIMRSVTKKYYLQLSNDEQEICGLYGLWKCIQNHNDSYGRKFTTSLFMHVDWECKREVSRLSKKRMSFLGEQDVSIESPSASGEAKDIMDSLDENQRSIMHQRFYENKTLEEIGKTQGYSKEAARQNINKILKNIKEDSEENGVY